MELGIRKYALGVLLCVLIVEAVALALAYFLYPEAMSWQLYVMPVVFYAVALLGIFLLRHFARKGDRSLVSGYMAVRGIRLILLVGFLLVLFIVDRQSVKWVTAAFVLFYIALLVYDTIYFSKTMKK
ncbi:MAG: hypothetical protein IKX26_07460 [Bacteroidales bacterium]|nr:hypothetical protein [Bacteroidales bacterium]